MGREDTPALAVACQIIKACNRPAAVPWSLTANRVGFKSRWHVGTQRKQIKLALAQSITCWQNGRVHRVRRGHREPVGDPAGAYVIS
jgi:hypothetical protein